MANMRRKVLWSRGIRIGGDVEAASAESFIDSAKTT
jgi:hypothetical protein